MSGGRPPRKVHDIGDRAVDFEMMRASDVEASPAPEMPSLEPVFAPVQGVNTDEMEDIAASREMEELQDSIAEGMQNLMGAKKHAWKEVHTTRELLDTLERRKSRKECTRDPRLFGQILVDAQVVSTEKVDIALALQKTEDGEHEHEPLGRILVRLGDVTEEDTVRAVCVQSGILMADITEFDQDEKMLNINFTHSPS